MCKIFVEKYEGVSDKDLIVLSRNNDQAAFEALFYRYLSLIKSIVHKNMYHESDFDDMLQDATIAFYDAVQRFDFLSSSFPTYLSLCVVSALRSSLRKASAQKRIPPNMIIPIEDEVNIGVNSKSAEEEFFGKNTVAEKTISVKDQLSDLEFKVLITYLNTGSYDSTATELNLSRKKVDNALTRIRKKLNQ